MRRRRAPPVTITVSSGGGTGTFGTTTPGTLVDSAALNLKVVSKYTAPSAGNVVKVTGYLSGLGKTSSSEKIKAIIYANSGRGAWRAARRLERGDDQRE